MPLISPLMPVPKIQRIRLTYTNRKCGLLLTDYTKHGPLRSIKRATYWHGKVATKTVVCSGRNELK